MQHNSFLHNVARTFATNNSDELKDYCFVFPNRRSGVFFEKELTACMPSTFILPSITTISDFVCDITGMVECSRIELLLDLYEEYKTIAADNCEPFDEFSYWGDVILNDFNDVDLYLADPDSLFTNLKEYKEIGTDYLSDEQKNALREYFGESAATAMGKGELERFWKHSNAYHANGENTRSYFFLWEMLGTLYHRLNNRLNAKGVAYSGQIYRKAVDMLKAEGFDILGYKQVVFVGFNVLSTSEMQIFTILKNKGIGDFYWDMNSPTLRDRNNKATRFLNANIRNFKSKHDTGEKEITQFPKISVGAIPSSVGQVKYAAALVERLMEEGEVNDKKNLIDTAIVLPDENLFIPLNCSIDSSKIDKVNITMGFPLKKSLIASLLSAISKAHRQSRKIKGEFCFYVEDVKSLLSHPYLKLLSIDEVQSLLAQLSKERLFFVKQSTLQNACPTFKELLDPVTEMTTSELISYTGRVLHFIEDKLLSTLDKHDSGSIEITCTHKYIEQFHLLTDIIGNYSVELSENTFFYLIDRFISGSIVSLQGEPLEGLQIMGVLETRCLDFKNVVILSMNERVFPRKHFSRSFIPYNIRRGFGMATVEHQESMYAYYFYRLISRAENVFLLYDARTTGLGSGDPSRYIRQLCRIYGDSETKISPISFDISSAKEIEIKVPKTKRVMEKLNVYRTDGSQKYLSASSINTYLSCPLQFYFSKVEGLYIEDEVTEFMNYSTFGTIIHEIMNRIYKPFLYIDGEKPQLITADYINRFTSNENHSLDKIITSVVNEIYYNKGKNCFDELDGEGYMIEDVIKHFVTEILKTDSKQNFSYIQGELPELGYWDELGINFKQYIDRVDKIDDGFGTPYLRIIDYKTGNDETSTSSFEAAMDAGKGKIHKAIIQVFLYCNFYNYLRESKERIKPLIYTVKDMTKVNISINKNKVDDYRDFNEDFMMTMKAKINEMFDENTPFTQTTNETTCKYCKYKDFCRR